jgi:hypothetical protein
MPRAVLTFPVLVFATLGGLRLGLPRFTRLLVESLPPHVLEKPRTNHPATKLLQRPIEPVVFSDLNLYQTTLRNSVNAKKTESDRPYRSAGEANLGKRRSITLGG